MIQNSPLPTSTFRDATPSKIRALHDVGTFRNLAPNISHALMLMGSMRSV
jgi:hypothetical protein